MSTLTGTSRPFGPTGRTKPTIMATIVGVINAREKYTVICRRGELQAVGYGHLGGSPAALSVEEVIDSVVEEREWRKSEPRQTCPETPAK